ncbi:hypothetical protein AAXE64_07540 [Priestia megaterium]
MNSFLNKSYVVQFNDGAFLRNALFGNLSFTESCKQVKTLDIQEAVRFEGLDFMVQRNIHDMKIDELYEIKEVELFVKLKEESSNTMEEIKGIIKKNMKEQNLTFDELKRMVEDNE